MTTTNAIQRSTRTDVVRAPEAPAMTARAARLWALVQAARDAEALAALAWAEALGPGHDEAEAWELARRAERAAFAAFCREVDRAPSPRSSLAA